MCFSAEASFAAATVLVPAGTATIFRANSTNRRYLPLSMLPLLLGLQQSFEGFLWIANANDSDVWMRVFSLSYMLFAWLIWPIWLPFSTYFLEPCRRRHLYLVLAIAGGFVGGLQYIPYFAHENWLLVRFFENAISYEGTVLFDLIMRREVTNSIYVLVVVLPLLTSSIRGLWIFGVIILIVILITYLFFQYAYISVFCFGAGVMSLYLVYLVFRETGVSSTGKSC